MKDSPTGLNGRRSPRASIRRTAVRLLAIATVVPLLLAPQDAQAQPKNVVFILSDDHRHDFMSFIGMPDFLETPSLDRMAAEGMHLTNAFVTTSLCSPSRASILTGMYAHKHGVVDNHHEFREGVKFFPEFLQEQNWTTAFVGKWHMGSASDAPRRGFDRWVSFRGQGSYFDPLLNVDGEHVRTSGYTTDILTDYAIDFLEEQRANKTPFLLYLLHKAVHTSFTPAPRHAGRYEGRKLERPATYENVDLNYRMRPRWVQEQRWSTHGVEYLYHGVYDFDLDGMVQQYTETLLGVDESVGRVLDFLEQHGLAQNTLVIYTSDNGHSFGEHGLIDKRHAYEESIRVPFIAWAPGYIRAGTRNDALIQNIDVGPTLLDYAGMSPPQEMDGQSLRPLFEENEVPWRDAIFYEYFWEWNHPQTPTIFAVRTPRYKYIFYQGVWDMNELYDLEADPIERYNLIEVPSEQRRRFEMRDRIFDWLEKSGGMAIPLARPSGYNERVMGRKLD